MKNNSPKSTSDKIPFWRDVRVLRVLFQVIFLIGVVLLAGILYANMLRGLRGLGLTLNLDFLNDEAGFGISEGIAYEPSDTYFRAFWVGVVNTIMVSIIGIVYATHVGACCRYCPTIKQLVGQKYRRPFTSNVFVISRSYYRFCFGIPL